MKTQIKWPLLVLAAITALTAPTERAAMAYEYVASEPDPARDWDDGNTPDDVGDWHYGYADGSGYADEDGSCTANAWTSAWAKWGESAAPEAWAEASWGRSWEWDGPPGAAPGGTLSWSYSGHGNIGASGRNSYVGDDGATSVGSFRGSNSGSGSGGGGWASGHASGYVNDEDVGSASASRSGDPEPTGGNPGEYGWSGIFEASIDWGNSAGAGTQIASGTSYVSFSGGAYCDTYSGAGAGPWGADAQANAGTSGGVTTTLSADFTSN